MIVQGQRFAFFLDNEEGRLLGKLPVKIWEGRKLSPWMNHKFEEIEKRRDFTLAEVVFLQSLRGEYGK